MSETTRLRISIPVLVGRSRRIAGLLVVIPAIAGGNAAASAADDSADARLTLAREYVAHARPQAFLDHLPLPEAGADADEQRIARVVRELPRDVMGESLAKQLAVSASAEALREAVTYAQSEAGRKGADCAARLPLVGQPGYECMDGSVTDQALLEQIARAQLGQPGEVSRLAMKGMETAMADALRALVARDADSARFFADYCGRKPTTNPCPLLRAPERAAPEPKSKAHD
ncbi:hypothetical protein LVB77_10895 [Lysobacter sp. 5GHs7-4]|uniref:hypothetical protein n=1 Tax=Lysobacter sp. 5GHs7-4 TaxID=2904253 RepID=UPI001E4E924A|nr:hypothetical protein [Lysobacter sp. 5GHs7-4]UHQ21208.1 hypothetical protein LVB77_10895 [Lysobacter sp. 5GHs7-4]